MKSQAGYGFNKAHSSAYALIAWQTMWLKTRYPKEFICAVLNARENKTIKNKYGDKTVPYLRYIGEARRLGIKVGTPNVNTCKSNFEPTKNGVIFGLSTIKYVSEQVADAVEKTSPYKSIKECYNNVKIKNRRINKRALESLINSNAFLASVTLFSRVDPRNAVTASLRPLVFSQFS